MDIQFGRDLAQQTVWLMAMSFILGSLFTIFILIILDMLRLARESRESLTDLDGTPDETMKEFSDAEE